MICDFRLVSICFPESFARKDCRDFDWSVSFCQNRVVDSRAFDVHLAPLAGPGCNRKLLHFGDFVFVDSTFRAHFDFWQKFRARRIASSSTCPRHSRRRSLRLFRASKCRSLPKGESGNPLPKFASSRFRTAVTMNSSRRLLPALNELNAG